MKITFDTMCREEFKCPNYIEWDEELTMDDHGRDYESVIRCVSCIEVGQSYNIEEYPNNCPHKKALDKYTKDAIAAHKRFLLKCEQDDMWERLNVVD